MSGVAMLPKKIPLVFLVKPLELWKFSSREASSLALHRLLGKASCLSGALGADVSTSVQVLPVESCRAAGELGGCGGRWGQPESTAMERCGEEGSGSSRELRKGQAVAGCSEVLRLWLLRVGAGRAGVTE